MSKFFKKGLSVFILMTLIIGMVSTSVGAKSTYLKGVATHFTHFDDTEQDLSLIYDSGVKTIRDTINWNGVEKQEGIYNWSNYDWWLKELEDNGIEAYICVLAEQPLHYTDTTKSFFSTEKEIDAFCRFLQAMIERYPAIRYIELWNEPNLSFGNEAPAEERMQCYINMVKEASKVIHQMNPDINIIGGCVANDETVKSPKIEGSVFLNTVLPEIYPYVDSFSMHVYVTPKTAESKVMENRLDVIDEISDKTGGWKKLYTSEVGWTTCTNLLVGVNERAQAANTVKVMAIMDDRDYAGTYIYDFRDDGTDKTETEHNFGLIKYDRTVKPAYSSFKEYLANTSGYNHVGMFEADGYTNHLYAGAEDALIIKWDTPNNDYYSEAPVYDKGITLDSAKILFKQILDDEYKKLENKASGLGINISDDISTLKAYAEAGKEEEIFYGNYELGNKLINMQLTKQINIEPEALSSLLYDIHLIGDKMADIYGISVEITPDEILWLNSKYEAINKTTDKYDDDTLYLSKAMVDTAKEKLTRANNNKVAAVDGNENGINYSLSGDSKLTVSGEAAAGSYISIKIGKKGDFVYADTICADSEGKFKLQIPLNGEDGVYDVTVGKSSGESISFSVEKKAIVLSMEYVQAQYILEYAEAMMLVTGYDSITAYASQSVSDNNLKTRTEIKCGYLPQNVKVFAVKYIGGRMAECAYEPLSLVPGESINVTLNNTYSNDSETKYKIFIWNENLTPYKAFFGK